MPWEGRTRTAKQPEDKRQLSRHAPESSRSSLAVKIMTTSHLQTTAAAGRHSWPPHGDKDGGHLGTWVPASQELSVRAIPVSPPSSRVLICATGMPRTTWLEGARSEFGHVLPLYSFTIQRSVRLCRSEMVDNIFSSILKNKFQVFM